jgi:hypothetical protein
MSKPELDNLVKIKRLKAEAPSRAEYTRMLDSASKRLVDAQNADLDADSQFDLAYGAAHRFALAALRREGYRSDNNRLTVFQTLAHTVGTTNADLQVFLRAHAERNLAEYEGRTEIDAGLLTELVRCTKELESKVSKLDAPEND